MTLSTIAKRRNSAAKIRTWRERCQDFDDLHITTTGDIQRVMQEEIDELREALANAAPQMPGSASAGATVRTASNSEAHEVPTSAVAAPK